MGAFFERKSVYSSSVSRQRLKQNAKLLVVIADCSRRSLNMRKASVACSSNGVLGGEGCMTQDAQTLKAKQKKGGGW